MTTVAAGALFLFTNLYHQLKGRKILGLGTNICESQCDVEIPCSSVLVTVAFALRGSVATIPTPLDTDPMSQHRYQYDSLIDGLILLKVLL